MDEPIRLKDATATGKQVVSGFVNRGPDWRKHRGLEQWSEDTYEVSDEARKMQQLKRPRQVAEGHAVRALGCGAADVGSLMRGRKVPADADGWDRVFRTIVEVARNNEGGDDE